MSDEKQIIEINGIKLEVDLRQATRVDQFTVGDKVKILTPGKYGSKKKVVHPGVIIGFEPFKSLPTIIIAYLDNEYSTSPELKFAYYNTDSTDLDIVASIDEQLPITKSGVVDQMDKEIFKKKTELEEIEAKKAYFLKYFKMYFKEIDDNDQ